MQVRQGGTVVRKVVLVRSWLSGSGGAVCVVGGHLVGAHRRRASFCVSALRPAHLVRMRAAVTVYHGQVPVLQRRPGMRPRCLRHVRCTLESRYLCRRAANTTRSSWP